MSVAAALEVVVYELLSLDGVAEGPDRFFSDWDDVMPPMQLETIGSEVSPSGSLLVGYRVRR
jgi:hypothetical protein